jgi:hypothetical protein
MFAISATPVRVYNSVEKKPDAAPRPKRNRHWRQHAVNPQMPRSDTRDVIIIELREQLEKYEATNKKLKLLARWNLRSTKSALKDVQEMLRVLDEHD